MSKNTWDAILASAPLNSTAGMVTSKGYAYNPEIKFAGVEWDGPPAILRPTAAHLNNPSFVDLSGRSYGRLKVLGLADGIDGIWVCRCACGKYVARRAKAIKNAAPEDRCTSCQHTAQLARSASGNNARTRAESPQARKW